MISNTEATDIRIVMIISSKENSSPLLPTNPPSALSSLSLPVVLNVSNLWVVEMVVTEAVVEEMLVVVVAVLVVEDVDVV